jgi:precorrin-3B synthase
VPVLDQSTTRRRRHDRCPGVTRPWIADDGALVRLRLVGGALPAATLAGLVDLAAEHGDGELHLTKRANLQLRGVPHTGGRVPDAFAERVRALGLLPSVSHELVRNVMVSPLTGRHGGRADLRPVASRLDRLLLGDPACAGLAGRFLFLLDDGRGDLVDRASDLAAVALDGDTVQLRAGADQWGPVVAVTEAAEALHALTSRFLALRDPGPTGAWHVDELGTPLLHGTRDERARVTSGAPAYGEHRQEDGRVVEHVDVPDGVLHPHLAREVLARAGGEVVVTPWRSLLLPDLEPR